MGASAPVDYLITSLLDPSDKIKEGYHTTTVTEKNGNVHSGGLVSDGKKEVVLRDNTGKQIRIARADIKNINISNFSMMPPGLTAGLREDEFVDLVRFLSELGKEGDFKTGPQPYIRHWKALSSHSLTAVVMRHQGISIFTKSKGLTWTDYYSRVNGEIRPAELPFVKYSGRGNRTCVVRFGLNPEAKGKVVLKINDTTEMHLFDGEKEIKLPKNTSASVEVAAGGSDSRFTLVVRSAARTTPILIEAQSK
tara:strand:- start:406 stop:1158 length:753 start_codon:yes stop_codon:yes gene_type:complete